MKRSTFFLALALATLSPAVPHAFAQPVAEEEQDLTELPPTQLPEFEPRTSERGGAFALRAGPYLPEDLLRNSNSPFLFEDLYGDSPGVMYNVDWEYQPLHHKYIGNLGIGLSGGFYRKMGKALKEDGTQSAQEIALMILPASADITYRMELWADQPVVPYAGAGLDYWYFSETKQGSSDSVSGAKKGWHWRAGGELLLDVFDERSAGALDSNWGINNTYIFGEYRSIKVNNFGSGTGFDFSDNTWFAGLLFEY
jgi:hypothetical protein